MRAILMTTIRRKYPNEWVLLGDPVIEDTAVTKGIVLLHHKDKKELTVLGRSLIHGFSNYKVVYTGKLPALHKVSVMRKLT